MPGNGAGVITKARAKPRNILRGAVPTASTWDTNPSNLEVCTDGDWTTATGAGIKITTGGGTAGYVTFDIGTPKTLILAAKVGISTDAGSTTVYLDAGETTGYAGSASQSSSASSETIKIINLPGVYARYIRLRAYTSQAATPTVKVYQIVGYDIGV